MLLRGRMKTNKRSNFDPSSFSFMNLRPKVWPTFHEHTRFVINFCLKNIKSTESGPSVYAPINAQQECLRNMKMNDRNA